MFDRCRYLIIHRQQRGPLRPPRVIVREDERERAQDVIEVGARQAVEMRDDCVNFVAETRAQALHQL